MIEHADALLINGTREVSLRYIYVATLRLSIRTKRKSVDHQKTS